MSIENVVVYLTVIFVQFYDIAHVTDGGFLTQNVLFIYSGDLIYCIKHHWEVDIAGKKAQEMVTKFWFCGNCEGSTSPEVATQLPE